jgi:hypothetical protein
MLKRFIVVMVMVLWGSAGVVFAAPKGEVPKLEPLQPPPADMEVGSVRFDGVNESAQGSPSSAAEQLGREREAGNSGIEPQQTHDTSNPVSPVNQSQSKTVWIIIGIIVAIGGVGIYLFNKYKEPVV